VHHLLSLNELQCIAAVKRKCSSRLVHYLTLVLADTSELYISMFMHMYILNYLFYSNQCCVNNVSLLLIQVRQESKGANRRNSGCMSAVVSLVWAQLHPQRFSEPGFHQNGVDRR
jgi:hypothetical protein